MTPGVPTGPWLSRRRFLRFLAAAPLAAACGGRNALPALQVQEGVRLNDVHSQLTPTRVARVLRADSTAGVQRAIAAARRERKPVAIAGGRYAMGGQQFATEGWLIDTRLLSHVRNFDTVNGHLRVDAGMEWPKVLEFLSTTWDDEGQGWTIVQKPTGVDRITIGGSVAANIHGNPLGRPPIVDDVERLVLVDYAGVPHTVSRTENMNLFRLAIGGYGLIGVVTEVTLRLVPRSKVERLVTEELVEDVAVGLRDRKTAGHLYADFRMNVDHESFGDFLRRGVLTSYSPVPIETPLSPGYAGITGEEWQELMMLAHTDPYSAGRRLFEIARARDGRIDWTDAILMSGYQEGYHRAIDAKIEGPPGTEVTTEIFLPRDRLADFMAAARALLRTGPAPVIAAMVRFVEPDEDTFLPWATGRLVGVSFDLHVRHAPAEIDGAAGVVRELLDEVIERRGTYHLTYHRWATREQIEAAYPRLDEFLRLKRVFDPEERFQSDWYRYLRALYA